MKKIVVFGSVFNLLILGYKSIIDLFGYFDLILLVLSIVYVWGKIMFDYELCS